MSTILMVILILLLIGALPTWPYSRSWGILPERRAGINCGHPAGAGRWLGGSSYLWPRSRR